MNFDISLDLYKVFCTVVQTGNMSLTAKQLYISQPAVSMAIKQLEDKLGKPLLVRASKGIRPTAEGQVLYEYLSQALSLIETAELKYLEMVNLKIGDVTLGSSDILLSQFLMPYIEEFVQLHANINIKVENASSSETLKMLKEGKIDIGFVNLPVEKDDRVEIYEIQKIHDCLIGGSKYAYLVDQGIEFGNLPEYPLLMIHQGCNSRKNLDNIAKDLDINIKPNIELSGSDLLIKFAKINLGLAVVVKEFSSKEIDNKTLFEIPLSPPLPSRAVGLAVLRGADLSYAASRFIKLFNIT